eukprot:gene7810-biopygen12705
MLLLLLKIRKKKARREHGGAAVGEAVRRGVRTRGAGTRVEYVPLRVLWRWGEALGEALLQHGIRCHARFILSGPAPGRPPGTGATGKCVQTGTTPRPGS